MLKGLMVDENMSNLTSASGEASASSGTRNETSNMYPQQSFVSANQAPAAAKKKRSLPGNPDPNAEVVALSPKTLQATNRFICEICNKGFQRDQNLQLHRRGHNLPWKLKQRTNKEVRKKVYVCPEPTCVHHDPSRALGDLTGIKKHFSRKHGEKKWKCEKCSKRYAVQSDWKAHSKICGTREYRCDCGTLFSRRDSFITHRAFCDALAEESARAITGNPLLSSQPGSSSSHLNLQPQLHSHGLQAVLSLKREQEQHHSFNLKPDIPPWPRPPSIDLSSSLFSASLDHPLIYHENPNPNSTLPSFHHTASPHMSATALLQQAAQMGVTMSKPSPSPPMLRPHQAHMSAANAGFSSTAVATSTAGSDLGLSSRDEMASGFIHGLASFGSKAAVTSGFMEHVATGAGAGAAAPSLFHDMMSSLSSASGFGGPSFEEAFNGMLNPKRENNLQEITKTAMTKSHFSRSDHEGGGGNDGLTRDFLGLRAFSHRDFLNIPGLDQMNSASPYEQQNQNQTPWQG
ncbi:hypothetical protein AAG906_002404 [Vitis piasezkii]